MNSKTLRTFGLWASVSLWLAAGCSLEDRAAAPHGAPPPDEVGKAQEPAVTTAPTEVQEAPAIAAPLQVTPTCIRRTDGQCIAPTVGDADGDGFKPPRDCNDNDPYVHPGAEEMRCNWVDEDCDGADYCPPDEDHDGYSPPADCDDHNSGRSPGVIEIFCNGIDENCNGVDDCDADHDGESVPADCDDTNSSISHRC